MKRLNQNFSPNHAIFYFFPKLVFQTSKKLVCVAEAKPDKPTVRAQWRPSPNTPRSDQTRFVFLLTSQAVSSGSGRNRTFLYPTRLRSRSFSKTWVQWIARSRRPETTRQLVVTAVNEISPPEKIFTGPFCLQTQILKSGSEPVEFEN